jgi:hypothetical protein
MTTPIIGKFIEHVLLQCYRKTGRWPETFDLIFKEDIPPGLQARADALRAAYDEDAEADRWEADEVKRIRATWTT